MRPVLLRQVDPVRQGGVEVMDQMMYGAGALWGSVLLFIVAPVCAIIIVALVESKR